MNALAELQEQVRASAADQRPLCIVGGNSKRYLGREAGGETVDMSAYSVVPARIVITSSEGW